MKCDICGTALTAGGLTILQGKEVSIEEMKIIVRNRFGPNKLGIDTILDTLSISGTTSEQVDEAWRQEVLADRTPWMLCPYCYEKTLPFAEAESRSAEANEKHMQSPLQRKTSKKMENCRGCGRSMKSLDLSCPYCGYTKWGDIIGMGIIFLLFLSAAIFLSPHIGSSGWRALIRWGGGFFGAIGLIVTLGEAFLGLVRRKLKRRPKVRDAVEANGPVPDGEIESTATRIEVPESDNDSEASSDVTLIKVIHPEDLGKPSEQFVRCADCRYEGKYDLHRNGQEFMRCQAPFGGPTNPISEREAKQLLEACPAFKPKNGSEVRGAVETNGPVSLENIEGMVAADSEVSMEKIVSELCQIALGPYEEYEARGSRAIKLGRLLHRTGGFELMLQVWNDVAARVGRVNARVIEGWWHGIGDWRG